MALKFVIAEPKAKVLFSPTEFFDTLKDMFRSSRKRIVISCLYVGIGDLEKELITSIKNNKNIKTLRVDILLDKQRATRPEGKLKESSVSVLFDLFDYANNINLSLFHNPLLGAILYNILPYRANEAIGVMHMKVFISDDRVILSGANLSDSYLRNRQDRYIMIENKLLADSVHKIVNGIQKMSFTVDTDSSIIWVSDLINPLIDAHTFREQYYRRIRFMLNQIEKDILKSNCHTIDIETPPQHTSDQTEERENFFSPLMVKNKNILTVELALQSGFSSPPIYDESIMLEDMLKKVKKFDQSLIISSGYLNFPENLLKLFRSIYDNLSFKKGKLRLITASPSANSFFKSKGITYYVPLGYTVIAHMCIEYITKNIINVFKNLNITDPLKKKDKAFTNIYMEYHKPTWTFHSKGMWLIDDSLGGRLGLNYGDNGEDHLASCTATCGKLQSDKSYECSEKKNINSQNGKTLGVNNSQNCLTRSCNFEKKNKMCANFLKREEINSDKTNEHTSLLTKNSDDLPWGTVIGSSNYGYRATYRDLEMSFVLKTNDENLKRQFQKELNIIYESSNFVHMNELNLRYPRWLRLVVRYIVRWLL
ncbi:phosphatidylglycerophosphate synthase [Plasmodium gonderi]|uniref:CDP-diacylglycerol--glycerol-3-phosphate 3-phosphatidyltransferase n=1 Tax=Plasmodium gonderi TaxID=77519 RepID=A0A1Y1JGY7_PLAGO|nr:phosphatidylglycerophosphate synthase [Plasmodium gonderi]GAW79703.1 phosphatidylglycerophosphate synthase [Plasmodium gonderi]